MERNPIVSTTLTIDGNNMVIEQDGYVGKLTSGSARLEITVPAHCAAFHVDGKKNVFPKKNISLTESECVFSLKIPIDVDLKGTYCTRYRSNNLRLLEIADTLLLRVWEVALVSRQGDFFVTCEHAYEFSCYRDKHGDVSCPYFEGKPHMWPQFVDMLGETLCEIADALPDESEFKDTADSNEVFAPSTGRVLWWSPAQGFGAIKTREGVARVHWSQIITSSRLARLQQNATVEFAGMIELATGNGTSFGFEAYGVRPK